MLTDEHDYQVNYTGEFSPEFKIFMDLKCSWSIDEIDPPRLPNHILQSVREPSVPVPIRFLSKPK